MSTYRYSEYMADVDRITRWGASEASFRARWRVSVPAEVVEAAHQLEGLDDARMAILAWVRSQRGRKAPRRGTAVPPEVLEALGRVRDFWAVSEIKTDDLTKVGPMAAHPPEMPRPTTNEADQA